MATPVLEVALKGIPVGNAPLAPKGRLVPTVLVAIMGPYPMSYGTDGRTTLDDTLEMCQTIGAVPVFIPDLITEEEKHADAYRGRLRGHTAMRNEAVRMALAGGYDYLFLLDNDASCPANTLERLLVHDQDIILPRLTYPDFDPVEDLCYGPSDRPTNRGLLRLTWAAHSCILFKVEALRRIEPPVWRGFQTEGEDHYFWQQQRIYPHMDMDTPIRVLRLAKGHEDFYNIPFRTHFVKGEACPGLVYLKSQSKDIGVYLCNHEGCNYEMITLKPKTARPEEMNSVSLVLEMAKLREYWAQRAPYYPKLEWPRDRAYLDALIAAAGLLPDDYVLDVGTGPGYIAQEAAKKAHHVIGLDVSPDMLAESDGRRLPNHDVAEGDIRAMPYPRGRFDKVFARMIVHGLKGERDVAMAIKECYRVLVPGGKFIFSEGIPPSRKTQGWYTEVFKLKEERLTMTVAFMRRLMQRAGFHDIIATIHRIRQSSVANWLDNSGLSPQVREDIMRAYQEMPEYVRKAYRATATRDDVLIDIKFATLAGVK